MKSEEILEPRREINRRIFCNRVSLTSVGLGLAANNLRVEAAQGQAPTLAYPPLKIEGAERVMRTGFVMYGPPPRPLDQILLQVRAGGEVWAVGKSIGSTNSNA